MYELREILSDFNIENIYQNSREKIKLLQKAIGVKDDGIIGERTIKALQTKIGTKSDGIWGKNSITAANSYLNPIVKNISVQDQPTNEPQSNNSYIPWSPSNATDSVQNKKAYYYDSNKKQWCNTKECAQWANSTLKRYTDRKGRTLYKESEIGGDAWTRLSAGENAKMVLSGYEGMDYNPNKYSEYASNKRNHTAANNFKNNFIADNLDKNKTYLVNMYYDSSPNKKKAWTNATSGTTGTHTGNAYWNSKTNSWHVAHNIHGIIHDDELSSVLGGKNKYGYGVTAIAEAPRVDYTRSDWNEAHPVKALINKVYDFGMWKNGGKMIQKNQSGNTINPAVITAIPSNVTKSILGKKYINTLNNFRSQIMQDYNLTDEQYADLMSFAVNIANQESKLGSSLRYKIKSNMPDSTISFIKRILGKSDAISRGLSQIKYNHDVNTDSDMLEEYRKYGITDSGLKNDPDQMAKASIIRELHGMKLLGDQNYKYSDNTTIPKDVALALWWNRGKLTDKINPNPNVDTSAVSGYSRRFEHNKIIK